MVGVEKLTGSSFNDVLIGDAQNNNFNGGTGNDVLEGGEEDDTLAGAGGHDMLIVVRGDDLIDNRGCGSDGDEVRFLTGVAKDQLWFQHVGNDLKMTIIGTADIITIQSWYNDATNHVSMFRLANGATLADGQAENLVAAIASFSPSPLAADTADGRAAPAIWPGVCGKLAGWSIVSMGTAAHRSGKLATKQCR